MLEYIQRIDVLKQTSRYALKNNVDFYLLNAGKINNYEVSVDFFVQVYRLLNLIEFKTNNCFNSNKTNGLVHSCFYRRLSVNVGNLIRYVSVVFINWNTRLERFLHIIVSQPIFILQMTNRFHC